MAIWFPSNYRKMAAWIHFPNVLLCDERSLTLGTCDVNARIGGRSGKEDEQVAFLAWKDSKIWETKVMFGAALTLLLALLPIVWNNMAPVLQGPTNAWVSLINMPWHVVKHHPLAGLLFTGQLS